METHSFTEEQQAFSLVRRILDPSISPERISRSEAKSYLAIVIDNNSHQTICRFYFNPRQKYIGTISDRKVETRTLLRSIDDICSFSRQLNETALRYINKI